MPSQVTDRDIEQIENRNVEGNTIDLNNQNETALQSENHNEVVQPSCSNLT